jgi:hypothetical protein
MEARRQPHLDHSAPPLMPSSSRMFSSVRSAHVSVFAIVCQPADCGWGDTTGSRLHPRGVIAGVLMFCGNRLYCCQSEGKAKQQKRKQQGQARPSYLPIPQKNPSIHVDAARAARYRYSCRILRLYPLNAWKRKSVPLDVLGRFSAATSFDLQLYSRTLVFEHSCRPDFAGFDAN